MRIGLFKRQYTVRRYGEQTFKRGHASAPYTDTVVKLNVQPLNPDELMALPEGQRTVKWIKSYGPDMLTSANEFTGTPGDRLFYRGFWYECKSASPWDHTALLDHYRSEYALLKDQEKPPEGVTPP